MLGHSFYSLCSCLSICLRAQRTYIFGMCFPFSCLISLQLFFRSSTPFLPARRFIRLTGKSSSDMSDASLPQDLSKVFSLPSSESLVWSSYSVTIQKVLPKGLPQIWKWRWWQKLNFFISNEGNFRRHFVWFFLRGVLATYTRVCHSRCRTFF